jgi:hypothetical protein
MKDEKYTPEVGSWLKGREVPHPDSQQTARQVAARLPHVGQRGRWWPLPSFRRLPTTDQTTTYQPSPIPASNRHHPTFIRRSQVMLSPAKATIAGAIVVASIGTFFIAAPFQQQGTVPSAVGGGEMVAAAEFSGQWTFRSHLLPDEDDSLAEMYGEGDGVITAQGGALSAVATDVSDPRFDGKVTGFPNSSTFVGGFKVWNEAWLVQNAEGAWRSEPSTWVDFLSLSEGPVTTVFHGEGAFDGLTAIVHLRENGKVWDLHGVIMADEDVPPTPDPRSID